MSDVLTGIKRAAIEGRVSFTAKAKNEMSLDGLSDQDVVESVVYADRILKRLRSTSGFRTIRREYLYVIVGESLDGRRIYSKGKFVQNEDVKVFYVSVSSKRDLSM